MITEGLSFTAIVEMAKDEAKGRASPSQVAVLSNEANRHLWIKALSAAIDDAEQQVVDRQRDLSRRLEEVKAGVISSSQYAILEAEFQEWMRKMARYRLGLRSRRESLLPIHANRDLDVLMSAVRSHRDAIEDPTDVDEELWAVLDSIAIASTKEQENE